MPEHQQQPTDCTCSHTCIAMAAGTSVHDVIEKFGGEALSDFQVSAALEFYGVWWNKLAGPRLMHGCWHLASVPSLNMQDGSMHSILIGMDVDGNGLEIMDPNKGRPNKKYYDENNLGSWSAPFIIVGA